MRRREFVIECAVEEPFMRPAVLVTRATFPDIAARLREHFDVEDNPGDRRGRAARA